MSLALTAAAPPPPAVLSMPVLDRAVSPLVIADHLITLAEHADRAGLPVTASRLVKMVFSVLDERGIAN